MALIRTINHNHALGKWAYIETSDEDSSHFVIIGDKEFDTRQEAIDHSKKFSSFSYVEDIDPNAQENKGILSKYQIRRTDGTPIDHGDEYFVLKLKGDGDPNHLEACRAAALVYAGKMKNHLPELSAELIEKYGG
jgi:hypothetical protein